MLTITPPLEVYDCGYLFNIIFINPSCDSVKLISFSVSGNDTLDFVISPILPLDVFAGTSSTITGTFDPQDSGIRNAAVTFHFIRTDGTMIDRTIPLLGIGDLRHIRVILPASLPSVKVEQRVNIPVISLDSSSVPVSIFDFALRFNTDLLDPNLDLSTGLFAGATVDRFNVSHDSISVRLRLATPKQITPGLLCAINCLTYITDTLSTVIALQRTGFGSLSSAIECLTTTNGDSLLFALDPQCLDSSLSHFLRGKFPSLSSIVPNPGTGIEKISYILPATSKVKIEIFNQIGQQLRVFTFAKEEAGSHEHEFDITGLPSGSYFFRVEMGSNSEMKTLQLLK